MAWSTRRKVVTGVIAAGLIAGTSLYAAVTSTLDIFAINANNAALSRNINAVAEGRNKVDVEQGNAISDLQRRVYVLEGAVAIPTLTATATPTPFTTATPTPQPSPTPQPTATPTPTPTATASPTPAPGLTSDQLKYGCVVPPAVRPATPYNTLELVSQGKLTTAGVIQITESNLEKIASTVTAQGRYGPDVKDYLKAAVDRAKSGYTLLIAFSSFDGKAPCSDFAVSTYKADASGKPTDVSTRFFRPTDVNGVSGVAGLYGIKEMKPIERN